jgi:hydroxymethylbilane synthase
MIKKIKIGTRGSKLALWQANYVKGEIKKHFDLIEVTISVIKTQGDYDQKSSLTKIGGQGIFTKAIEKSLIDGEIDLAVHSLKDLPSSMSDSLILGAVPKRGVVNDILIGREKKTFDELPRGAKIGSGSIRRRSQILLLRPDIKFVDLRGNIETRLNILERQGYDGIIMAEVALIRLNIENVQFHRFSIDEILPAVGQGAIGIQTRKEDDFLRPILDKINDKMSFQCITAERAFLHKLDSGCQFPVAAYAERTDDKLILRGLVAKTDGSKIIKESITSDVDQSEKTGISLAEKLIDRGAKKILEEAGN